MTDITNHETESNIQPIMPGLDIPSGDRSEGNAALAPSSTNSPEPQPSSKAARRRVTQRAKANMRTMVAEGMEVEAIAKATGYSMSSVNRYTRAARRRRGGKFMPHVKSVTAEVPHQLRHQLIERAKREGVDLSVIIRRALWASIQPPRKRSWIERILGH